MFILLPFCWLVFLVLYPQPAAPAIPHPIAPIDFLFKSADGGQSWQGIGKGFPSTKQPYILWADDATLYLGGSDGLYKGNTALPFVKWEREMLMHDEITGIYHGQYGNYALSPRSGLYQNEPLTGQWRPMHENLKDKTIHTMMESKDGGILACCESGIYSSVNKGKTWKQIFDKGPAYKLIDSNGTLLCCSPSGLWRSTDGGDHWTRTLTSVNEPFTVEALGQDLVSIAPGQEMGGIRLPNIVYLSGDQGLTWKPINQSWPSEMGNVYQVSKAGDFLLACSNNQIYRSSDRGATWTAVLSQGDQGNAFRLTISGKNIYALLIQGC